MKTLVTDFWEGALHSIALTNFLLALLILVYVAVNWEAILDTLVEIKLGLVIGFLMWAFLGWIWFETTLIYYEYGGPRAGTDALSKRYEDIFGFGDLAVMQGIVWVIGCFGVFGLIIESRGYVESISGWLRLRKLKCDHKSKK